MPKLIGVRNTRKNEMQSRNNDCLFLADNKLSKCPMCGTARNSTDETCSYCGYIYEDTLGSQQYSSSSSSNLNRDFQNYTIGNETLSTARPTSVSFDTSKEAVLKTQDNVIRKNSRAVQEGALLLTNRRLVFAVGKSAQEDADVQELLQERDAFAIPLEQIVTVSGNRGILRPSLNVVWHNLPGDPSTTKTEFLQKYRPANMEELKSAINEWVPLVEKAATSDMEAPEAQTKSVESTIDEGELRSRVLEELGDMHWKGFFQIEKELDEKYGTSIDPDVLEACCAKLVKEKLVEQDKHGEFYRKISQGKK